MSGIETAIIGTVLSTAISATSTIAGGAAANKQAKYQSRILQQQADQERAAANREAQKKRDQTELVLSRQQAVAAASGGGPSDPTIIELMSGTEAEGEVQAEETQYLGEVRANSLENQAAAVRARGKAARTGALLEAAGTVIGKGVGLFDKYNGRGGAPTTYSQGRDPMRAYLDPKRRTYDYGYF